MQQRIYSSKVIWWMHRSCSTRLTIVFLVTAAFPLSVVKIGVRTEIYQSLIDESKPGFLPVSDSIFFSWWFGRVGDCHILEEPVTCIPRAVGKKKQQEDGGNRFLGTVGAYPQGHMVASQRGWCFLPNYRRLWRTRSYGCTSNWGRALPVVHSFSG